MVIRAAKINNKQFKHYVHSPFQVEENGIRIECDEHGKLRLTQDHPEDDSFDEIDCSASLINLLSRLVGTTTKRNFKIEVDKEQVKIAQYHSDGTYDLIECSQPFLDKVFKMLAATRRIEFRDEPFKMEDEE